MSVEPVENVESSVQSHCDNVDQRPNLHLLPASHNKLWQDGNTLLVDGECPQDLHNTELVAN